MEPTERKVIKTSELQVADQVRMSHMADDLIKGPYLVKQIHDGIVYLWRPYISHGGFQYTGGVIPYVGIEEFNVLVQDSLEWLLLERTELK